MLGEFLGLWRCCWLEDFDGEMVLRIARKLPLGRYKAIRYSVGCNVVRLEDGSLRGPSFVHHWHWNKPLPSEMSEVEQLEKMMR